MTHTRTPRMPESTDWMLHMKRIFGTLTLGVAAVALVAGCTADPDAVLDTDIKLSAMICQSEIAEQLRDPGSAKFDQTNILDKANIAVDATGWKVEGNVRGKNAFGGYGDRQFWSCAVTRVVGERPQGQAEFIDITKIIKDAQSRAATPPPPPAPAPVVAPTAKVAPAPVRAPAPSPVRTTVRPAPVAPKVPAPPVGLTGAPNGAPAPLAGKAIAQCMSDPALYQRGTTKFTDGTTGWTAQCANGG